MIGIPPPDLRTLELREEQKKTKRPNKHTHRAAWNEHFERDITLKYADFSYNSIPFEEQQDAEWAWNTSDIADVNQDTARIIREIMRDEDRLMNLAFENLVYGDFEADWTKLDVDRKKDVVLEGLYHGACDAPRDNSRISCPEMTIDDLIGDGEYNLINLLKHLIAHHPTFNGRVRELYLFIHPYVEHESRCSEGASDQLKAYLYRAVLLRNFYIVDTLIGILEAYHNRPTRVVIPARISDPVYNEGHRRAKQTAGAGFKAAKLRVDNSQCKEEAAIAVYACYACCKGVDGRHDLKRCGRCRLVWYCSKWVSGRVCSTQLIYVPHKDCQKKDWNEHKRICGKRHFDPKLLAPTPEEPEDLEFIGCPEAVAGFIRSRALLRQICCLAWADSQGGDYHFNLTVTHTRSVLILDPHASLIFLVARRRAMTSGSLPAIYKMMEILESQLEVLALTREQIRRQFEIDYGINITTSSIQSTDPFVSPTVQEFQEEMSYMLQREASVGLEG